ncbi:MAG: DUF4157 domain-containing protein [Mycobacterium sp.]|uniref:eCIS core domain-containing protein n=1 Tax=Mycobacterium sp. TaxID=1785 RepID=UPI002606C2F5|nr:DUF4157 domain-containing protein [Mycobacterium sp.]MDI3313771.1 DUF4157 domain-containing protein [Mycobacterium sp.]
MRVIPASPVSSVVIAGRAVWLTSYGGPASAHLLARISDEFGAAVEDVRAFWGGDWPREIAVVLTGTEPQFRAQVGGGDTARQWSDIAAVTVADRVDPVRRLAFGQRIVFAPGALAMSRTALRIVLAHELFHYVARRDTALDAPRWLAEGVADFVARPPVAARGATTPPETLPSDADLDAAGPQRSLAYDRAWLFARFVAATYGIAKLRALYLAACGVDHADLPGALRTVLGTDAAGVLAAWQRWLVG